MIRERFKGERRRPGYLVSLDTLGKTYIIVVQKGGIKYPLEKVNY